MLTEGVDRMNIFDNNNVVVTEIISAAEKSDPAGFNLFVPLYRNHDTESGAFYTLSYTLSGEPTYTIGDKVLKPKKNEIMFLDKIAPFEFNIGNEPHRYIVLNFRASSGLLGNAMVFRPNNYQYYLSKFEEANKYWKDKTLGYQLMCTSVLYDILGSLKKGIGESSVKKNKAGALSYAMEYMLCNMSNPYLSMEDVAAYAGMSGTYFRRLFMREYGTSPLKYLKNARIKHAKDLICVGEYSVSEIAKEAGFSSPGYFCTEFKRITGRSPSEYIDRL